ncbi:MAG: hydrolase, partial [Actinobacteria bacterium]|nr:hydrolase [Actinomycetota bacterium]
MEKLSVGLVQFSPSDDAADNREVLRDAFGHLGDADLIVLPEYSAWFHTDTERWHDGVEPIDGPFVTFLREQSRELSATILAGLLVSNGDSITNTVVAVDAHGV